MQDILHQSLRHCFVSILLCAGVLTSHSVQAAATFKADTGELFLPAVMVDWDTTLQSVTLKRSTLNTPLSLGDSFEIKTITPNVLAEERNSNFLSASSTAYVPDVRVSTAEGEKTYRLLLQFIPQKGTLRISSMEDATVYSSTSGEPGISTYFQHLQQQIHQAEMPATCSNASLYGIYGYGTGGTRDIDGKLYSYLEIGVNYFDGTGVVYNTATDTLNYVTKTLSGTYSVASNCQAKMNYGGNDFFFFTPPMGDKFYYIQTTPQGVLAAPQSGWMERQTKGLETGCTVATLKGTYAYGARGTKEYRQYTESGLESYDGQGHVTNIYTDNTTGQTQYSKGTYIMTEYCDALVTYESGDAYLMHVAPDGASMPFIQYAGLKEGDMFGGYEHRVSMITDTFTPPATRANNTRSTLGAGLISDLEKCPIGYVGSAPTFCKPDSVDMSLCNQPSSSQYRKETDIMSFPPEERCIRNVPQYGQCESGYTLFAGYCKKNISPPASAYPGPVMDFYTVQSFAKPEDKVHAKIDSGYTANLGAASQSNIQNTAERNSMGKTREECAKQGLGFIEPRCSVAMTIASTPYEVYGRDGNFSYGVVYVMDRCKAEGFDINYVKGATSSYPGNCTKTIFNDLPKCVSYQNERLTGNSPVSVTNLVVGNMCDIIAPARAVQNRFP